MKIGKTPNYVHLICVVAIAVIFESRALEDLVTLRIATWWIWGLIDLLIVVPILMGWLKTRITLACSLWVAAIFAPLVAQRILCQETLLPLGTDANRMHKRVKGLYVIKNDHARVILVTKRGDTQMVDAVLKAQ